MASGDVIVDATTNGTSQVRRIVSSSTIEFASGPRSGWSAEMTGHHLYPSGAGSTVDITLKISTPSGAVDIDSPMQRDKNYRVVVTEV